MVKQNDFHKPFSVTWDPWAIPFFVFELKRVGL